jgi:hypothetical protein
MSLANDYGYKNKKCTAYNWQFGAMAAVTPRKWKWEIERLSPAETLVEAATAPSPQPLAVTGRRQCVINKNNN